MAPPTISIHALLAESDSGNNQYLCKAGISIHALLAESDHYKRPGCQQQGNFYPRSPCGERPEVGIPNTNTSKFLSTLSLRRATRNGAILVDRDHISIHALLAESDQTDLEAAKTNIISIHALLAESDGGRGTGKTYGALFLSTLSLRRATIGKYSQYAVTGISIHALLAESDLC